ncbi:hypothetical protein [Ferruginibacter sp.]|nr:hypothetical protein [Ferruginibacter sp.]
MAQKKEELSKLKNEEMRSANENIYDMFSIEELESRLQMSAAQAWCDTKCGTHSTCQPVCTTHNPSCTTDQICGTIVPCVPNCGTLTQ